MENEKKRILFLCTGNAARSQMAEALARIDYGDVVEPVSAGSRPAGFVHPLAVHAIAELGVSIEEAESKHAEDFSAEKLDLPQYMELESARHLHTTNRPALQANMGRARAELGSGRSRD